MCLHAEKMVAVLDDSFPGNLEKLESDEGTGLLDKMDEHDKDCVAKKMKNGRTILGLFICAPLEKHSIIFMLLARI